MLIIRFIKNRPKGTKKILHIQYILYKICCKTHKWLYILSTSPFNASTGLVLIRRWLPFRKTPSNALSTNNGGGSTARNARHCAILSFDKSAPLYHTFVCPSEKITPRFRDYEIIYQDRTGTRSRRQRRDVSPLAAHRCRLPTRQPHHTQNQNPTPTRSEIPLREIRYRGVRREVTFITQQKFHNSQHLLYDIRNNCSIFAACF